MLAVFVQDSQWKCETSQKQAFTSQSSVYSGCHGDPAVYGEFLVQYVGCQGRLRVRLVTMAPGMQRGMHWSSTQFYILLQPENIWNPQLLLKTVYSMALKKEHQYFMTKSNL